MGKNTNIKNRKTIICIRCGKELKDGFYNSPEGIFCPSCWEEKPQEERERLYNDAVKNIAELVKGLR